MNIMGAWLVETYKGNFATEIGKGGIDGLIKTLTEQEQEAERQSVQSGEVVADLNTPQNSDSSPRDGGASIFSLNFRLRGSLQLLLRLLGAPHAFAFRVSLVVPVSTIQISLVRFVTAQIRAKPKAILTRLKLGAGCNVAKRKLAAAICGRSTTSVVFRIK